MKLLKLSITILLTVSALNSFSQDSTKVFSATTETTKKSSDDKMKTLLSLPKFKHLGIYIAPEYQLGTVAGQFTSLGGASVMLVINKKLSLGVGGYMTNRNFTPTDLSAAKLYNFNAQYGGLKLEYTPNPNAPIHVSFPLMVGMGNANIDTVGKNQDRYGWGGGKGKDRDNMGRNSQGGNRRNGFFLIQPGINIEANLVRFVKLYVGASYRITGGTSETVSTTNPVLTPTASQLGGFSLSAGLKIGIFDYALHAKRERRMKRKGK
jgi:hypothetical protein